MREKLFLKIHRFSPYSLFCNFYLFFDTKPYLADQLFVRHKVRVWFDGEYSKDDEPYLAIICHVRKKDASKFENALEDLKKSMALCGHPHYEMEINKLIGKIERETCGRKNNPLMD